MFSEVISQVTALLECWIAAWILASEEQLYALCFLVLLLDGLVPLDWDASKCLRHQVMLMFRYLRVKRLVVWIFIFWNRVTNHLAIHVSCLAIFLGFLNTVFLPFLLWFFAVWIIHFEALCDNLLIESIQIEVNLLEGFEEEVSLGNIGIASSLLLWGLQSSGCSICIGILSLNILGSPQIIFYWLLVLKLKNWAVRRLRICSRFEVGQPLHFLQTLRIFKILQALLNGLVVVIFILALKVLLTNSTVIKWIYIVPPIWDRGWFIQILLCQLLQEWPLITDRSGVVGGHHMLVDRCTLMQVV